MCGIAGIVSLEGPRDIDPARVRRMADAIVHRGPDDDGYFAAPGLAMANRRLSIVGLADGKQPIHNEDRSVSVVFNGELYDYPEVRAALESRGHVFRTHCDTELLPHLWEDHGPGMWVRLRGQFAVALWDQRAQTVTLARDRFGICPLFWTRRKTDAGEVLLFASEIKALLASGLVPAQPDVRGINHVFTFFALPGPVTCFEGVNCLLPGHTLTIDLRSGAVVDRVYWEIDFPDAGDEQQHDFRRFGDNGANPLIDEFEAVMQRSVQRRLRADVPVVSYLSGGVDSSIVVALACAQRQSEGKEPIPTFTIGVNDPAFDERSEAADLSRRLGTKAVTVGFGRPEVLAAYPELIRAAEGPVIDTACAALLALAKSVHEHGYKVALTGEGADEWLAGYPWYKSHRMLGHLDVVPGLRDLLRDTYLRAVGSPRVPENQVRRALEAVAGPNAWLNAYGLFSLSKARFFSEAMWAKIGDHVPFEDLRLNLDRAKRWNSLNRSLYVGARVMLPGLLLSQKGDRVAMNASVETRYPFLDEEVFDFLAPLAPGWKIRGLTEKLILRYLAQRWIPKSAAWRRKAMFRAPLDGFHLATMPTFVDELLSPESLRKSGYFDVPSVTHWRTAYRNLRGVQRTMVEMGLVGVVATQLWHQTYIDGSLAALPSLAVTP
ncbi:MAG TPA: asparagine synthase (glutamine-hydrolyzing) [Gemmataceae bacterium]|jgi:asparagine synthase (glutamine-hydrolysing)|nr:asparagine synthase (glutamine-hydrolyzing) [Gemmataceae bacterium]